MLFMYFIYVLYSCILFMYFIHVLYSCYFIHVLCTVCRHFHSVECQKIPSHFIECKFYKWRRWSAPRLENFLVTVCGQSFAVFLHYRPQKLNDQCACTAPSNRCTRRWLGDGRRTGAAATRWAV